MNKKLTMMMATKGTFLVHFRIFVSLFQGPGGSGVMTN